ncbi:CBBY-like protein [Zingiber officinale]|uniref:CBBY-like protein n=1 Tax=Zingiber officinale TaxID=94328 RepID=UPI001C4DC2D8|nr:CBBY-like protein [Zingiber officinale]
MAAAAARCLLVGRALLSPLVPRLDNSRNPAPSPLPSVSASSLFDSSCFPSCKNFTYSRIYAAPLRCLLSDINESNPGQDFALLLEVEGVVADIFRLGNRQAFNTAFQKLGLDCANWTEPIYTDLMRKAAGDEKRMLILFFNRIGWPASLPTNEKEIFMKNILQEKKKALEDFATSSSLTLRPGVGNFIDDALHEGVPVVLLIAYSKYGEKACRSIIGKLGQERLQKVKVVGKEEVKNSLYGQLVLGKGVSSSLDELLAKEVRKAASMEKQRIAHDVASILKLSVDIDTSSSESFEDIIATLRAGAEYACLPIQNCVLIAGSQPGVYGSERVGMPCVVMRSGSTARAEFRSAKAVMDAFGGADLTVAKLLNKKWY